MRLANKCARERMTVLYDQSAAFEGLVIGTSNKTELLLGYGTQFGDLASALNPIGDLYKTQLRGLAEHLGVPQAILEKEPSGDLWVGQTDEGELGFSYAEVDRLLILLVDRRWQPAQLVEAGFEADFVELVLRLIRRNQYKRRLPVIAKLTHRTMDRDFRYPRDWGT
jgi:NAD+ synthase